MLRRYYILTMVFLSFQLFGCREDSDDVDPIVVMPEHTPSQFYKLDVKTKFMETFETMGIKQGTIALLSMQKWCRIDPYNEDYSVWITNFVRIPDDPKNVILSFDLALESPSMFFEGYVYKKKNFRLVYDMSDVGYKGIANADVVAASFKKYAEKALAAGIISAYVNNKFLKNAPDPYSQTASKIVEYILSQFPNQQSWEYQQVEAVICGVEITGQLKEWLWEMENKPPA